MTLRAVSGPHTLDGGDARACQARSVGDGLPTTAQRDDASMYGRPGDEPIMMGADDNDTGSLEEAMFIYCLRQHLPPFARYPVLAVRDQRAWIQFVETRHKSLRHAHALA